MLNSKKLDMHVVEATVTRNCVEQLKCARKA